MSDEAGRDLLADLPERGSMVGTGLEYICKAMYGDEYTVELSWDSELDRYVVSLTSAPPNGVQAIASFEGSEVAAAGADAEALTRLLFSRIDAALEASP